MPRTREEAQQNWTLACAMLCLLTAAVRCRPAQDLASFRRSRDEMPLTAGRAMLEA